MPDSCGAAPGALRQSSDGAIGSWSISPPPPVRPRPAPCATRSGIAGRTAICRAGASGPSACRSARRHCAGSQRSDSAAGRWPGHSVGTDCRRNGDTAALLLPPRSRPGIVLDRRRRRERPADRRSLPKKAEVAPVPDHHLENRHFHGRLPDTHEVSQQEVRQWLRTKIPLPYANSTLRKSAFDKTAVGVSGIAGERGHFCRLWLVWLCNPTCQSDITFLWFVEDWPCPIVQTRQQNIRC